MKVRKLFLLMAVAVAVLAVPASASAAEFLHEGKPFKEHVEMKLTGGEVIETGGGVMLCESNLTITTEGGSSGVASYEVKPASCTGLAGNLEGCTVSEAKSTGTPWTVDVNAADLTATGFKVDYTFAKGCPVGTIEVSFPELTLVPFEEASSINLFEWSTEGPGKVDGKAAEIGYFGSASFPEEEFGTYGIG
jgi:hypothetical protein